MMKKEELSALLYEFLEVIYLLKKINDAQKMSVGMIAQHLHIPLFRASRLVARLEGAGWVKKTQAKDNRRVIHVGVTGKGKKLLTNVENYQFKLISKNIAVLKSDEVENMASGLVKLRSLLDVK